MNWLYSVSRSVSTRSASATIAGCMYIFNSVGTAIAFVTSGIWNVASVCVFRTIGALPRSGFCV